MSIIVYILLSVTLVLAAAWLASSGDIRPEDPKEEGVLHNSPTPGVVMAEGVHRRPTGLPP